MKRITCFTESLGGGGAEHQMVILAGMLAEKGYDVTLVTYASLPDHYETPQGVKRLDIGATRIKGKHLMAFVKLLKVFFFFLRHKTNCIISYRQCANIRVLLPMFFRSRRIKVICSDRNTSQIVSFQHNLLLNGLYKRADYIVPNSNTQALFISNQKPALSSKIRTIHNYTDLNIFTVSKIPEDLSVIRIAVFSRYSHQKNPMDFAEAIKELKKQSRHSFEVHWYGSQEGSLNGFNSDYLNLKQKIEEFGIEDVLILHEPVRNPSLLMDCFHAICLPSLYEGFSNSISEGICSGKPMLVSDVSDNSVMVRDGENGFLFNPTKTESICEAFLKFFSLSYERIVEMSIESRRIAEGLFDKESFIQHYIDLIEA